MASPIEDQLFNALCAAVPSWDWVSDPGGDAMLCWHRERIAFVHRNQPILTYRVDLLVVPGRPTPARAFALAIECDGHEFHDRTKQQAAYDRARDRELLLRDVTTIRFTGSEIFHSPERCAAEALDVFARLSDRASDRESYSAAWGG